jgi:hypothetical protein
MLAEPLKLPGLQEAFDDLLDVFSGGDNSRFFALLGLVREMDKRATNGDAVAVQVLQTVIRMHNLINTAKRLMDEFDGI